MYSDVKGYTESDGSLVIAKKSDGTVLAKYDVTNDTFVAAGFIMGQAAYPITVPLGRVRGSTGLVTTATPADSVWAQLIASNVHGLTSNLADGGTKTATGTFQVALPNSYIAGEAVTVKLTAQLKSVTGTGVANNGSDLDILAYRQDPTDATVGSDICATAAATFAALDTVYVKSFTITPTTLGPGDVLNIVMVGRAIENDAGNGTLQVVVHNIEVSAVLAVPEPEA